jgi:hypothetical protein
MCLCRYVFLSFCRAAFRPIASFAKKTYLSTRKLNEAKMKLKRLPYWQSLAIALLVSATVAAQEAPVRGRMVVADLHGGIRYEGIYQGEEEGYAIIEPMAGGELRLATGTIRRLEVVPRERFFNGEYWPVPRSPFQNLLSPTSFGPQAGELHYQNVFVFISQVTIGIDDRFSTSIVFPSFSPLGLAQAGLVMPFALIPKVALSAPESPIRFGVGAMLLHLPEGAYFDAAVLLGTATFGTLDRNFSFGLGHGFIEGRWAANPSYFISGYYRSSKKLVATAEAWVIPPAGLAVGTVGFKLLGRRMDWGFSFPAFSYQGDTGVLPFPIVSFNTIIHRF